MEEELIESFEKAWEKALETVKGWGEDITSVIVYTPHGRIDIEWGLKGWRMTIDD